MATRKKSSGRKKSARAAKRGGAKRGAKRGTKRGGMKTSATRNSAARSRPSPKRSTSRRSSAKRRGGQSPMARVKRVAREVAQQATAAVSAGVETVKDLGENLVDRVSNQLAPKPEQ
jgi:hypothetical protein